jgi:dTDP-4-dehydrorhamnose 3,5-epimerase
MTFIRLQGSLPSPTASSGNFAAYATALPPVLIVASRRFGDHRGHFTETWSARDYAEIGIPCAFEQDNQSFSAAVGTLRGLHWQTPPMAQAKLVRCLRGAILDVAVDIRRSSPTFGQSVAVELTADNGWQLFVPEGFAHGFCTLEPDTEVAYKVSRPYSPQHDRALAFDCPRIGIAWPFTRETAQLSAKDAAAVGLDAHPDLFA